MIYSGFPGVGKSSIAGNGVIDLESSNFNIIGGMKDKEWYKYYCNIAEDLSKQGYTVLICSHNEVLDELIKREVQFKIICPSLDLKDKWIERLEERYERTKLDKDYRALQGAIKYYDYLVKKYTNLNNVIIIEDINYDLRELIK